MDINVNWYRWIFASVAKHFDGVKGSYTLYIEGDERNTNEEQNFAELRMDGPFIKKPCKQIVYLDVEVNLLIQSIQDHTSLYAGLIAAGVFAAGFVDIIKVYKYGDGVPDDDSLLGCLRLRDDRNNDTIDLGNFGIIRPDTRITQLTIEGHYRMELSSE